MSHATAHIPESEPSLSSAAGDWQLCQGCSLFPPSPPAPEPGLW